MSVNCFRGASEWALMVGLVFGAGALVQAQEQPAEEKAAAEADEADVIQIGKPDHVDSAQHEDVQQVVEQPKHWIGLLFGEIGPDSALRYHLDLPEGQGLLIEQVLPKSPAEKAGLKRHDIILRANDGELRNKQNLVDLVLTAGEKKEQIALEVLRHGKRETVYITPEERPADAMVPGGFGGGFGGAGGEGREFGLPGGINLPEELLREFGNAQGGGGGFQFRNFGPGVILGDGGQGTGALPDGVSISVQKQADQPAKATVTRGNETWEVTANDKESLEKLPEDLRPIVENLLHGRTGLGLRGPGQRPPMPEFGDGRLRERLERMEKQLEEMRERMQSRNDEPVTKPANHTQE